MEYPEQQEIFGAKAASSDAKTAPKPAKAPVEVPVEGSDEVSAEAAGRKAQLSPGAASTKGPAKGLEETPDDRGPVGPGSSARGDKKAYAQIDGLDLDPELLHCVLKWRMPYGRFETWPLLDLPEPYVVWIYRNALPKGKLGEVFGLLYEIKVNGIEAILRELQDLPLPARDTPSRDK